MSKKRLLILVAVTAALSMPAHADLAAGVQALDASDYATAHQELLPLAKSGNADAAWHLARMYENGWGVAASHSSAAAWYRKAGEAGKVEALFRYGEHLEQGLGVVRSRKDALDWYKKAAAKGLPAAMTKVGLYALNGIAGKPNFLTAKRWLSQAAEAGDPDAQAILDDLAARRYPVNDAPGSAKPDQEAARRVLDEVKDLIAPMLHSSPDAMRLKLARAPVVTPTKDGHTVTLPQVELHSSDRSVRLGDVQIAFTPDGADYAVKVRLPMRARVSSKDGAEGATVSLGRQTFTGKWSTALHTLTDYTAELGDLRLKFDAGDFGVVIGGVAGSRRFSSSPDGRYDISEQITLKDVVVDAEADASGRRIIRAGAIAYSARYEDLDLEAIGRVGRQVGIDWRTGAAMVAGGDLPRSLPPMLKDVLVTARVQDVALEDGAGKRLGGLADGEVSLAGAGLDQALSAASLTYVHDGLDTAEAMPLPRRARAMVTANRLPLPQLVSATLSSLRNLSPAVDVPTVAVLERTLRDAKTELRINEIALAADTYTVTVAGLLQPAEDGFTGALDVTVGGLDKLAEAAPPVGDGDSWARLRALAVRKRDKSGQPVDVFNVAFLAAGKVTINGKDAAGLFGN